MIQSPSIERLKTTPKDKGMKSVSIKTNKKEKQKNALEEADKIYKFFSNFLTTSI